ncbi:hypothetical protein [Candidatus Mycalebacterium sp.]
MRPFFCFTRNALLMVALAGVVGCQARPLADAPASVDIIASKAIRLPAENQAAGAVMELPVTVRLRNHRRQTLELSAGTPCAVFRWRVVAAGDVVQSMPNRSCIQTVAFDRLGPARQLEQSYVLALDPRRYTAGSRYRLVYTFWGYPGRHDFTVKNFD